MQYLALLEKYGPLASVGLLSFAFLVVAILLSLHLFYNEKRILKKLSSTFKDSGLQFSAHWSRQGRASVLSMSFFADLPKGASGFSLSRRGKAKLRTRGVDGRGDLGNSDFHDYFCVEGEGLEYLTPARQALLLDVFPKLPGEVRFEKGFVRGTLPCEQSPQGIKRLIGALEEVQVLRAELEDPLPRKPLPAGWVAGAICREMGSYYFVSSVIAWGSASLVFNLTEGRNYDLWLTGALALSGLLFAITGGALWAGLKSSLLWARRSQWIGSFAVLASAPLWLKTATWAGTLMCPFFAYGAIATLRQGSIIVGNQFSTKYPLRR